MEQVAEKKIFFNVFPTLKVEEDIQILFADVEVQKITTNSSRDFLPCTYFQPASHSEKADLAHGAEN